MFKICNLALADESITLPIIDLETKNYDIYGFFEAKITVLFEREFDIYTLCGEQCFIGSILTGFINKVSNISLDNSLFSINVVSGLSLLYSNNLTKQIIFPKSSIKDIFLHLSRSYFSTTSLIDEKKSILISPGSYELIIHKLLENYKCRYIFLGKENEFFIFKDFKEYKRYQLPKAINLKYKFEYDINSSNNYYFSHQTLGDCSIIETNNLNITPGYFITLDNERYALLVKSVTIKKNINKLYAVATISDLEANFPCYFHVDNISTLANSNTNKYDISGIQAHIISYGSSNNWGTHIRLKSEQKLLVIKSDLVVQDIYSPGIINRNVNCHDDFLLNYNRKRTRLLISKALVSSENSLYKFSIKNLGISMFSNSGSLLLKAKQFLISSNSISESAINYRISSKQMMISTKKMSINTNIDNVESTDLYLCTIKDSYNLKVNSISSRTTSFQARANSINFETKLICSNVASAYFKGEGIFLSTIGSSIKFSNQLLSLNASVISISAATIACSTPPPKVKI